MADKVKFNLKNVHYALLNEGGTTGWGTPKHIPGAVSLEMEPQGEVTPFYADGIVYYQSIANNGYQGDLEMAMFPTEFLVDVLGMKQGTTSKVLTESASVEPKTFALLFEEDGDAAGTKFVMYSCTATRPTRSMKTTEDTKEPATQKLTVTAIPMEDGNVMAMTDDDTPDEIKKNWYKSVYVEGAGA